MLDVGGEGVTKNKGGLEIMAVVLYIYVHFIFWDMEVLFVGFCVFFWFACEYKAGMEKLLLFHQRWKKPSI